MASEDARAMSKDIKKIIELNFYEITNEVNLESTSILENLRTKMVLDRTEIESITNAHVNTTSVKKVGALLDTIIRKGPIGFHMFCESLEFAYPRLFKLLTGKDPSLPEEYGNLYRNSICGGHQQLFSWQDIHNFHKKFEALNKECAFLKERNAILQRESENFKRKCEETTKILTGAKWKMQLYENIRLRKKQLEADLLHLTKQSKQYLHQTFESQKQVDVLEKKIRESTDENEKLKIELSEVKSEVKRHKTQTKKLNKDLEKVQSVDVSGIDSLKKDIEKLRMDIKSIRKTRDDVRTDPSTSSDPNDHRIAILHEQVENLIQDKEGLVDELYKVRNECFEREKERDKYAGKMDLLVYRITVLKQNMEILKGRREDLFNKLEEVEQERNQAISDRDRAQEESNNRLAQRERIYHELVEYQRRYDTLKEEIEEQLDKKNHLKVDYFDDQTEIGFRKRSFRISTATESSTSFHDNSEKKFEDFKYYSHPDVDDADISRRDSTEVHPSNSIKRSENDPNFLPEIEHQRHSATSSSGRDSTDSFSLGQVLDDINRRSSACCELDLDIFRLSLEFNSQEKNLNLRRSRSISNLNFNYVEEEKIPENAEMKLNPSNFDKKHKEPKGEKDHLHRAMIDSTSFLSNLAINGGNVTGFFLTGIKNNSRTANAGLLVGDQLLLIRGNVNGKLAKKDMQDMTSEVFYKLMEQISGELTITIRRNNVNGFGRLKRELEKGKMYSGDHFYIRVVRKIDPPKIKDYSLNIKYGMILHVTNTWFERFPGYWYAFNVDKFCQDIQTGGTIPDKERAKKMFRQTSGFIATRDYNRSDSLEFEDKKSSSYQVGGGLYSSINLSQQPLGFGGFYNLDSEAYAIVEPKDPNYTRPILIIGPTLIVNVVQLNLTTGAKSKSKYAYFETELSNSQEGEDVVEWEKEGSMFAVTSISSIKKANKNSEQKHCILNIQLENVVKLYDAGIYPIIIYLKPDKDKNHKSVLKIFQDPETKAKYLKDVKEWEEKYSSIINNEFYPDYYDEIELKDVNRKGLEYLVDHVHTTIQEKNSQTFWVTKPHESSI